MVDQKLEPTVQPFDTPHSSSTLSGLATTIDLLDFLSRRGVPTDLCVRDDLWSFLEAYALVIEDGSLFCALTTVEAVTFSTRAAGITPSNLSFAPSRTVWPKQSHNGHTALKISAEVSGDTYAWGFRWR